MFFNFSNVEKFLIFCQKKLNNSGKKTLLGKNTIWKAFYSKVVTFAILNEFKIFFEKRICFFQKRPINSNALRKPFISVAFHGKFAKILWKKTFEFRNVNEYW